MRRGLFLLCALVALVIPISAGAGLNTQESSLLREMNRVRNAHNLPALQYDAHLQRAASAHSREMLESNTFSHGAFGSRMLQFDVSFNTAGENLAWDRPTRSSRPGSRARSIERTCCGRRSAASGSATSPGRSRATAARTS